MDNDSADRIPNKVVVNHEEQYSIWPSDRPNPAGWTDAGFAGTRRECLAYIDTHWTNMTPLSVRQAAEFAGRR